MVHYQDKTASLTPLQQRIIIDKATEYPHSGVFNTVVSSGTYLCRRCGLALFRGENQFSSGCGWPSFDEQITNSIQQIPDKDGQRIEILCARCSAHLGHVFQGEFLTNKNLRHCVNSASLDFVHDSRVLDTEEAVIAGGCFWGVEYYIRQIPGVLLAESGYTGGHLLHPSYQQVCEGNTGHYEAVRVLYDKTQTSYSEVLKRFFELHDPTQKNGQGPDLGQQYQSAVFVYNEQQKQQVQALIQQLIAKGYTVATQIVPAQPFWPAEDYHQEYYHKQQKTPYCHRLVQRFR